MIEFHCPHCNTQIRTPCESAGRAETCESCSNEIVIPQLSNSINAYQQTRFLILNLQDFRLLPVCHKTGKKIRDLVELELRIPPNMGSAAVVRAFGGTIAQVAVDRVLSKTIRLKMPVDKSWIGNAANEKKFAMRLAAIAFGLLFGGMALAILHPIFAIFFIIGFIGSFVALILGFIASSREKPFEIVRADGNFVWVVGVKPEILALYPSLPKNL